MEGLWVAAAFAVSMVGFVGLILALVLGIIVFLNRVGGLPKMAERYRTALPLSEPAFHHTHVKIGAVRWRFCSHVAAREDGLHVDIRPPLARGYRMLIPWEQFGPGTKTLLYLGAAMRFPVGAPPPALGNITVPWAVYETMRPYLSSR